MGVHIPHHTTNDHKSLHSISTLIARNGKEQQALFSDGDALMLPLIIRTFQSQLGQENKTSKLTIIINSQLKTGVLFFFIFYVHIYFFAIHVSIGI